MAPLKTFIIAGTAFVMLSVLMFKLYSDQQTYKDLYLRGTQGVAVPTDGQTDMYAVTAQLIQQRNTVSRQLNLKQQQIGQMECEKNKDKRVATSNSGGWCQKASSKESVHHMTDQGMVNGLALFFKGKDVASFGDGPGMYKKLILETGLLKSYDAFDGAPFAEQTTEGRVAFLDLTLQQYGLKMYDWVLSLEVAEHIPAVFEAVYLDNIARHAREGVILSWSRPGQEGYSHVNNRPFEYVVELMQRLGFEHDPEASKTIRDAPNKLPWLKNNTNVYRRKDMSQIQKLETLYT